VTFRLSLRETLSERRGSVAVNVNIAVDDFNHLHRDRHG